MSRSLLILIWVVSIMVTTRIAGSPEPPMVPSCEEDQVITGVGDFNVGYWTTYVCSNDER